MYKPYRVRIIRLAAQYYSDNRTSGNISHIDTNAYDVDQLSFCSSCFKGEQLWCSPVQSPLTSLVCDRERGVVITVDSTGLVKTWQGQTGVEVASYATGSPHCSLLQCNINNRSFLSVRGSRSDTYIPQLISMILTGDNHARLTTFSVSQVGTNQGFVSTLVGPALSLSSRLAVCDSFPVNLLLLSPDKKWVLAASKDNANFSPKVFSPSVLHSLMARRRVFSHHLPRFPSDVDIVTTACVFPFGVAGDLR